MFLLFFLLVFELMCVKSFVSFSIFFILLTLIKKRQSFQTNSANANY